MLSNCTYFIIMSVKLLVSQPTAVTPVSSLTQTMNAVLTVNSYSTLMFILLSLRIRELISASMLNQHTIINANAIYLLVAGMALYPLYKEQ